MNSSESPGRKNPTSNPDSANTMAASRKMPPLVRRLSGFKRASI
jgi:hypothetical protein